MDIIIHPVRSILPDSSQGANTRRAFEPRERFPVPGNPQAEVNRPEISPGIIPVAQPIPSVSEEVSEEVEMLKNMDELKKKSLDFQIINRVLDKEQNESDKLHKESTLDDTEPVSEEPEVKSAQRVMDEDVREIVEQARLRVESRRQTENEPEKSDPLALDLDGNGLQTTGIANGFMFDINADGRVDKTSFISGGDAFVALDKNNNGHIDDGSELFGDQNGSANGYLELAHYDDNQDGRIDENDAIYSELALLSNNNGQPGISSLSESGIKSINLNYSNTSIAINTYDRIAQMGTYERDDGTIGTSGDVILGYTSTIRNSI